MRDLPDRPTQLPHLSPLPLKEEGTPGGLIDALSEIPLFSQLWQSAPKNLP